MGTKEKPGAYDCYAKAFSDEPMFVLLARDRHAPAVVRQWANMREQAGEHPDKVREARQCASDMEMWSIQRERPMGSSAVRGLLDRARTAMDAGDTDLAKSILHEAARIAGGGR